LPGWDKCQGRSVSDDERIAGCTTVIEAGKESGHDLAVAYCNRGLALTGKRQLDEARKGYRRGRFLCLPL
jgi:hypothetical protein